MREWGGAVDISSPRNFKANSVLDDSIRLAYLMHRLTH